MVPGKAIFTALDWVGSLYVASFFGACLCAGFFVCAAYTVFLAADLAAANAIYL
jgi:hypothetical protein